MSSERFTIKIPCKPYVRVYLEINCGEPVNLKHLPILLKEFKRSLSKKPEHREKACVAVYPDTVSIIIPTDLFYRYGWEMNRENVLDFNRLVELQIKFFMRQYISVNNTLGISVANSIREFQERFGFNESIWAYESIKKDFDRNGKISELKLIKGLKGEIHKILLDNLSCLGTVSKKLKNEDANCSLSL